MRRFFCVLAAGTMAVAMAVPVIAQAGPADTNSQPKQMASVKSGNVIIEGGGGSTADLNVARYKAWDEFRSNHPEIVREIRRNPRLVGSQSFLRRHPALARLFDSNPGMQQSMMRYPGNYVVPAMTHRYRMAKATR